ncbi:MAG: hypothetical protein ACLGIO_05040 [Acidimicrobiia bacterium]
MVSDGGRLQRRAYVQARIRDNGVLTAGDDLNPHEHGGFEI